MGVKIIQTPAAGVINWLNSAYVPLGDKRYSLGELVLFNTREHLVSANFTKDIWNFMRNLGGVTRDEISRAREIFDMSLHNVDIITGTQLMGTLCFEECVNIIIQDFVEYIVKKTVSGCFLLDGDPIMDYVRVNLEVLLKSLRLNENDDGILNLRNNLLPDVEIQEIINFIQSIIGDYDKYKYVLVLYENLYEGREREGIYSPNFYSNLGFTVLQKYRSFNFIFLGNALLDFEYAGNDPVLDRLDTIIHEFSHRILNTTDHAYGYQNCINLSDVKKIQNADNYAFFCCDAYNYLLNPHN